MEDIKKDILIVEPFNGGSHGQLINLLQADEEIGPRCEIISLPARKWQWRARTSALYFSQIIPSSSDYRLIFTSSVLNLAELVALRPDIGALKKIVYFHENQLVYPVRKSQDRDFQYGYNQILTSLVADVVVFNSEFNMKSFLSSIQSHLKLIPNYRPSNISSQIESKCSVLNFPIQLNEKTKSVKEEILSGKVCDAQTCMPEKWQVPSSKCKQTPESLEESPLSRTSNTIMSAKQNDPANVACFLMKKPCDDSMKCVEKYVGIESVNSSCDNLSVELETCDISLTLEKETCQISLDRNKCNVRSGTVYVENVNLATGDCKSHATKNNTSKAETAHILAHSPVVDYIPEAITGVTEGRSNTCLHIVWPHRWEHDKDPEFFFKAILQLQREGSSFCVSVIGETYQEVPEIFYTAKLQLADRIKAWGYQRRENYLHILNTAHIVVSTAVHEFFGVSMLEAVSCGCYPLCPQRLVYPEIYPKECLYSTQAQLVKRLRNFCMRPSSVQVNKFKDIAEQFAWTCLQDRYRKLLLD